MNLKQTALIFIGISLAIGSILLTPRIDSIQLNNPLDYPFFYARSLPVIYYVATVYLVLLAVFGGDRNIKLLSVMLVALLVQFTLSIMLTNPWIPDQYPYLAEATWLVKNHHITRMHNLDQTPGLGLLFAPFMLVTGLGPFQVSKFYPLLIVLVMPLAFLTGEKICGDGALPSLLFFGLTFHQPNAYHRNTFFLILFIVLLFVMVKNLVKRRVGYLVAYTLTASALVISYSGTIVPFLSLALIAILFALLDKGRQKVIRFGTPLLFITIFFSWYAFAARLEFDYMFGKIYSGLQELIYPTTERMLEITAYGEASLTEVFQLLMNVRSALTIMLVSLAMPLSIYILLRRRNHDFSAVFISSIFLATTAQFVVLVPFIYYGLPLVIKLHTFFVYLSVLCVPLLLKSKFVKYKDKVKLILGLFALILLLLVPLLSYSTIPFLHSPTSELKAKVFIDTYYRGRDPILATELNLPYGLSMLLMNRRVVEPRTISRPEEPIRSNSSYWILQRFMTRDGYVEYPIGYKEYLKTLISSLSVSHNLVYASGNYTKLFLRP